MKICKICQINKEESEYHKKAMGKGGLDNSCKACRKMLAIGRYQKSRYAILKKTKEYKDANKKIIREKNRKYDIEHAKNISERKRKYRQENRQILSKRRREYTQRPEIKLRNLKYQTNKMKTDSQFYLKNILRKRINNYLNRKNLKKIGSAVLDLGCSIDELRNYLQFKFTEGMTWENRGKWHIDHIIPLCKFNLSDREQFLKACHYTNLQPLWAEENLRKNRF